MGVGVSNPVDESTKQEIQELIKAMLVTFTREYVKAYALNLVIKLKRDAMLSPLPWKLLEREPLHDDLKFGYLTKEGAVRKNWKKRYFVVRHDYKVDYYESEGELKKPKPKVKGTMNLAGYRVIEDVNDGLIKRAKELAEKMGMDVSELPKPKEYPKHTFEIHHYRRRSYYLQASNEEEYKQWVEQFKTVCWRAYGLNNREWVAERAFRDAVRKTRWELGRWGWWSYGGSEDQILSDLIADQIDYAIMGRIYGKITGSWMIRNAVRNQVLKTLDTIISTGVAPAWKAMATTVEELRPKIEPTIREMVDPIGKAEGELVEKIKDGCMSIINPILQEHVTPHLSKIVACLTAPMNDGSETSYQLFEAKINEVEFIGNKDDALKAFHSKGLNWYSRSWDMYKATEKANVMYEPLWALNVIFPDIYPWSLIWDAHDDVRHLMDNALYTFEVHVCKSLEEDEKAAADAEASKALIARVKAKVMEDYRVDGRCATTLYYGRIIKKIVMPPFNGLVIPACKEILSPLAEAIPEPLRQFIDIFQLLDDVLNGIIDGCIETVVSA